MGDHYYALADRHASATEAPKLAERVVARLADAGFIEPDFDPEATLGGGGHRPGRRLREIYNDDRQLFLSLSCNGVQAIAGRWFNMWGLTRIDGFTCLRCDVLQPMEGDFWNGFGDAIGHWLEQSGSTIVRCPACREELDITDWKSTFPMAFCNLAFEFWNWPQLDELDWGREIITLVEETTAHKMVLTYGRI